MTYFEFMQWAEFYHIEPFGFEVEDLRHAELQATVANVSGNLKKPLSVKDFMRSASSSESKSNSSAEINDSASLEAWLHG